MKKDKEGITKMEPVDMYKKELTRMFDKIKKIDKKVTWQEREPDWWLGMMEIESLIRDQLRKLNKGR